jgi:cytochrome c biogenesis protein CcdA
MNVEHVGLAFTAGVLAILSPCALPLLPSYVVYYLNQKTTGRIVNVFLFSFFTMIGFLSVFTLIGLFPSIAISFLEVNSKIMQSSIGIFLIIIGVLYGFTDIFNIIPRIIIAPSKSSGLISYYIYGVGYAFASMSCSLPVFMLILGSSISVNIIENVFLLLFYGLGVGSILFFLTITVYFSKDLLLSKILNSLPLIKKISAIILILSGFSMLYLSFTTNF